jgi:hypothetical protein
VAISSLLRRPPAWALAVIFAVLYGIVEPPSADLAAQEYRAHLFADAGFTLWNNGWYGGHHTLGYSVLSPPLGAAIGVRLAGALLIVVTTVLFARLAHNRWDERGYASSIWFAVAVMASVVSGRMTFTLGVAAGLAALLALQRSRGALAAVLAVVTSLSSPVAGVFVAIAVAGWGLAARERRGRALVIAAAAVAPALALGLLFPEKGSFPFVASAFWPALAAIALFVVMLPPAERELRVGAGVYALACIAAFAVATPLGANVTRLGAIFAGPLIVGALAGRRSPRVLALVALPLAYWSLYPAVRDVVRVTQDRSAEPRYHAPLVAFLESRPGTFRVEVPFTANKWEAYYVARHIPLARGWERQLDRRYNGLFYDGHLDAARYRAWLNLHAVRYVALPDVPLDYAGRDEARLIEGGLDYLRPVWRNVHWRVFAVVDPAPLAEGVASAITLSPDGFSFTARRAGDAYVRVRHTRWWTVTRGDACVTSATGGMTRVRVRRAGTITVQARLSSSAC